MVEIGWDKLDRLLGEDIEDLMLQHYSEVAMDQDAIAYAPDWDRARAMERRGDLKIMSAREDGTLVGYSAFVVQRGLHYRHSLLALNDVIYIAPSHRRGLTGVRLIRWAESRLREIGAVKIIYHTKLHVMLGHKRQSTLGDLLERLGYSHDENMHAKVL